MKSLAPAFLLLSILVLASPFAARAEDESPHATGVAFLAGHPPFAEVLAGAQAAGKPVFIDFSTEWCGWCRRLEKDVFSREDVAQDMQAFVNVSYDAEKGEGPELAQRYAVNGFPTLVVVDGAGDEVDRIVGYLPPDGFRAEIARILRDEGTVRSLRRAYEAHPDDVEVAAAYARKLLETAPTKVDAVIDRLSRSATSLEGDLAADVALLRADAALARRERDQALEAYETLVLDHGDTPAAIQAALKGARLTARTDPVRGLALLRLVEERVAGTADEREVRSLALQLHLAGAGQSVAKLAEAAGDDADALNEAAWTSFLHKLDLRAALGWAEKAVELSGRAPHVLDTLANLLFEMNQVDRAVEIQEEAVQKIEAGPMKADLERSLARFKETQARRKAGEAPRSIPAIPIEPR